MSALGKPVRVLLGDGTVQREVLKRLRPTLAKYPVNPADWSAVQEAHVRMAVAVTLKAIHTELSATPGLPWDESMALDALLGQDRINDIMVRLRELGAAAREHSERGLRAFRLVERCPTAREVRKYVRMSACLTHPRALLLVPGLPCGQVVG